MGGAALPGRLRDRRRGAPAALRSGPGHPKGVGLRRLFAEEARLDDAAALAAIEKGGGQTGRGPGFAEAMASPRSRVVVLRSIPGGEEPHRGIRAYCVLRVVADEMEILGLAVVPEWRGRGLGRFLLRRALALGRAGGARTAFLEVREANASAIGLYESLGFRETGRRRSYYRDPDEDALVLSLRLAGSGGPGPSRDS